MKSLEKGEFANFQFQKDFLRPQRVACGRLMVLVKRVTITTSEQDSSEDS